LTYDGSISRKFIPLLLATSPRLFGYTDTAAFAPVTTNSSNLLATTKSSFNSHRFLATDDSNMTDEVAAAKAAAAEYKSSESDGAGQATAFDNILSGK